MKLRPAEVPPPGAGFCTVTVAVPAELKSDAGICAVSPVLDTYVVGTVAPFHCTWEAVMKWAPVRVRVKAGQPTTAIEGDSEDRLGAGFGGV